jgi:hypothetical protein
MMRIPVAVLPLTLLAEMVRMKATPVPNPAAPDPEKLCAPLTVTVAVPAVVEPPGVTATFSGATPGVAPALVPRTDRLKAPVARVAAAFMVRVLDDDPAASDAGVNTPVRPVGAPSRLKSTAPTAAPDRVTVTAAVRDCPAGTSMTLGLTLTVTALVVPGPAGSEDAPPPHASNPNCTRTTTAPGRVTRTLMFISVSIRGERRCPTAF